MKAERASKSDAAGILGILACSIPSSLLPLIPLGCPGARQYLEDLLTPAGPRSDSLWMVLRSEGEPEVAGFAELRLFSDELLLNHIYVSPERRASGAGTLLLAKTIEAAMRPSVRRVRLDVFLDNERPMAWYSRLGFVAGETRAWLSAEPGPFRQAGWSCVEGLPQADCVHARYGFSRFGLRTERGTYDIGRLGSRYFRSADSGIISDPAALSALAALDPARSLVSILLESGIPRDTGLELTCLARAIRMAAEPNVLMARLSDPRRP